MTGNPPIRLLAGLALLLLAACADDNGVSGALASDSGQTVRLVDTTGWTPLPHDDDPWSAHRPDPLDCARHTPHEEDGLLEFDTKICPYFAVSRPSDHALEPGDSVVVLGSHSALVTTGAAGQGHFVIQIGDTLTVHIERTIPGRSSVFREEVTVREHLPAGTPVRVHVRNHGANAWRLHALHRAR